MEYSNNNKRNNKRHWNNKRNEDTRRNHNEARNFAHKNHDTVKAKIKPETKLPQEVHENMQKSQEAIKELKQKQVICPICKSPITELASALADKNTGEPVHFDCVIAQIEAQETLGEKEKITYIGQGRFAVVTFPNPNDTKNFSIVRVIEWEQREKKYDWRQEIAGLYSQVH